MSQVRFGPVTFDAGLVIFDKDGTLFPFHALWQPVYLRAVAGLVAQVENPEQVAAELHRTLGYDPATERFAGQGPFASAANDVVAILMAGVLYRHGKPQRSWDAALRLVQEQAAPILAAPAAGAPLAATDLERLFTDLRNAGVRIAVLTSDEAATTRRMLQASRVAHLVDMVVAADDGHPHKPAPEAVWHICATLQVPPPHTALVGDTVTDLRTGEAAGVGLRVAVLTGPSAHEELAPHADVVLASIQDIQVIPRQPLPDE